MARTALINRRPWLLLALVAAVAFYFLQGSAIGGVWLTLLKGAAVGALSVYAYLRHTSPDARILATALAFAAVGDMAIRFSLQAGGVSFAIAHGFAIALYARNVRTVPDGKALAACAVVALAIGVASWALSFDLLIGVYGLVLGTMASAAFLSRFPRWRVVTGAALFVVSDLLIFADAGNVLSGALPGLLIWPLYFIGQFLIATGVIQTLRKDTGAAR
ncbi:MAG: lysoplasmalogenase [Parerythrobacter sp.]